MTQQELILDLLKENGNKGLNSYDADYIHHVKQAPTRIHELKQLGHVIVARNNPDKSVNWILINSPVVKQTATPKADYSNWVFDKNGNAYVPEEPRQMEAFA